MSCILTAAFTLTDLSFFNVLPIYTLSAFLSHHFLGTQDAFSQEFPSLNHPFHLSVTSSADITRKGPISFAACQYHPDKVDAALAVWFVSLRPFLSLALCQALALPAGTCWLCQEPAGHSCLRLGKCSGLLLPCYTKHSTFPAEGVGGEVSENFHPGCEKHWWYDWCASVEMFPFYIDLICFLQIFWFGTL